MQKIGGVESLNFDFYVFNFDTMKRIFCVKTAETLIPQGFWNIEKERKLQYQWYHNFRSYLVRMTGFEPAASCSQSKRSTKLSHIREYEIVNLGVALVARVAVPGIFVAD